MHENINGIQECIKEKMGNDYDIKIDELKKPKIKIVGIKDDLNDMDIENDIIKRNKFEEAEIRLVYKYTNEKNNTWSIILELNKVQYVQAKYRNRIYIGSESCRLFDFYDYVTLCYKCLKYGHKSSKCKHINDSYRCYLWGKAYDERLYK